MKKTGLTAWLTYASVRTLFMVMQAFPIDWNLRTARLLARVWIWITPRHRDLAIAQISASFPNHYTPKQTKRMA